MAVFEVKREAPLYNGHIIILVGIGVPSVKRSYSSFELNGVLPYTDRAAVCVEWNAIMQ